MTHRRIPSLNWLRVFETAARTESFARAAEFLNMSPPAVSQQIKALESHLGKPLFARGPHHVSLTDEGRAFLPVVQQALSSVETTAAALFGGTGEALLTIRLITLLATSWLPGRLPSFEAAHPGIRLQINAANTAADFRDRRDDLHIGFGSATDFPSDAVELFGESLFPVARPEIAASIEKPADLLKHRLIEVAEHRSGWFQLLGEAPDIDAALGRYTFADTTVIAMALAAAGNGIALARAPASDALMQSFGLHRCGGTLEVAGLQKYYAYAPGSGPLKPAAQAFLTWLQDQGANSAA